MHSSAAFDGHECASRRPHSGRIPASYEITVPDRSIRLGHIDVRAAVNSVRVASAVGKEREVDLNDVSRTSEFGVDCLRIGAEIDRPRMVAYSRAWSTTFRSDAVSRV
jgi:hypothetical protein